MFAALRSLLGLSSNRNGDVAGRSHVLAQSRPVRLYAIGDIHGCFAELVALEHLIGADAAHAEGEKWIVTLGDYIDRGPAAAQVVSHLMEPPPTGFKRLCLAGNHEQMLLDFLADPRRNQAWLDSGGWDTVLSYGLSQAIVSSSPVAVAQALDGRIPSSHKDWLRNLPVALALPGFTFVHAGLRPGIPLDRQTDEDLMWIREPFLGDLTPGSSIVVHGHTPETEPTSTPNRIGIDTASYATGRLTAMRLDRDGGISFLSTR